MTSNLVSLPYKSTVHLLNLSKDLLAYRDAHSIHTHPLEVKADVDEWGRTRERIFGREGAPMLPSQGTADELSRYYAQLSFVLTKLPSSLPVPFPWFPLFSSPSSSSSSGPVSPTENALEYERANVLYNLAACYAQMGAERRRGDEEGIKAALGYFQTAAGLLAHLLTLLPRLSPPHSPKAPPADPSFHPDLVSSLQYLCLAQAQEVAWQKAVMDRLKNGTVAKVALKAAEWYQQALDASAAFTGAMDAASSALVGSRVVFPWDLTRHLLLKSAHFTSVAHYRKSLDDLGANRYGDELGRLELAERTLREALVKAGVAARRGAAAQGVHGGGAGGGGWEGVLDCVVRDLKSLQKTVSDNLARATKDNNLIYLATPTSPSLLPPLTSAPLARPLLPPTLSPPAPPPTNAWLAPLVPREVGAVLELWEDRKREWVRGEVERRARDEERAVEATLAELELPALLEDAAYSSSSPAPPPSRQPRSQPQPQQRTIPPSLLEKAATVQAEGGVERLETMMKDVRRVAGVNQKMLQESLDLLSSESALNAQHLAAHGPTRWTRPSSDEVARPLRERAEQLSGLLESAGESDQVVRRKFGEWEEAVRALSGGEAALKPLIPAPPAPPPTSTALPPPSTDEIARVRTLRSLLESLSDLRASRRRVVEAAQTAVGQADVREGVLREAERLERERERASGGGGAVEGQERMGLAQFEELLGREMERLRGGYEGELERLRGKEEDLLGLIKTAHSSLLSLRSSRLSCISSSSPSPTSPSATSAQPEARQAAIARLDAAFAKFVEMRQNLLEGLRFYGELGRLLGELRDGCKSFNYTRSAEAQDLARSLSLSAAPAASPRPRPTRQRSEQKPPPPAEQVEEDKDEDEEPEPVPAPAPAPASVRRTPRKPASAKTESSASTRASSRGAGVRRGAGAGREGGSGAGGAEAAGAAGGEWQPGAEIRFG
ncbi:hypothetical protein JCM6882_002712 [Rhodosporidiobolus microsporus]